MTTDDELARVCEDGYPRLVAALTHQFGDRHLAEDLAQDALVRLCDHWGRVQHLASPMGWAYRCGVNAGSSWFRRRAAERRARGRTLVEDVTTDPDTADRIAVRDALQSLTPRQREAVVLRYYLRLTPAEIAEATGSTPGAVRVLVHRGVAALRDDLDLGSDELADHHDLEVADGA